MTAAAWRASFTANRPGHRKWWTRLVDTIAVTILLSVVAHGITARPLATRYVRALSTATGQSAGASEPNAIS